MNVAFDPWIPVMTMSGESQLASLYTIFTEGEGLADLAVRPHERVALMRLFICVAHAALNGPQNYDEWCKVPERLREAASEYLKAWKDSFELFHPTKPWLQVASLKPSKEDDEDSLTSVNKLDFSLASSLFNHFQDTKEIVFTESQLAIGLLTIQNFSTCGLISQPIWEGTLTAKSAKDAPCIASSMYHVFLLADNLYTTICENICDFNELTFLYNNKKDLWLGRPVWEYESIKKANDSLTQTFLGRLVPLSRAVLLKKGSSRMLYGEGLRYKSFPEYTQEFNTSVTIRIVKKKEVRVLVGAKTWSRPWRQLDAILQYNQQDRTISQHAIPLNHLSGKPIDIWVGALLRNPGKQDILDTVESRFHIPEQLRSANGCATYAHEVEESEKIFNKLDKAIYFYKSLLDPVGNTSIGSSALSYYWTSVENNLLLLMAYINAIDTDNAVQKKETWHKMLFKSACEAYQLVCNKDTPRQMMAFLKGWHWLTS
jgi:CRISPR system Cascade subunit CasA